MSAESDVIKYEVDRTPDFVKLTIKSLVLYYIETEKKLKHINPFENVRHYVTTQCATVEPAMLVLVTNAYEYHK